MIFFQIRFSKNQDKNQDTLNSKRILQRIILFYWLLIYLKKKNIHIFIKRLDISYKIYIEKKIDRLEKLNALTWRELFRGRSSDEDRRTSCCLGRFQPAVSSSAALPCNRSRWKNKIIKPKINWKTPNSVYPRGGGEGVEIF